jgi:hypothetical protein
MITAPTLFGTLLHLLNVPSIGTKLYDWWNLNYVQIVGSMVTECQTVYKGLNT